MNSLKEQIRQRKIELGGPPEGCATYTTAGASTLRLEASSGETWVLPWHHFIVCRLDDENEREALRLTFVGYEVVVRGVNLEPVAAAIARQSLVALRTAQEKYARAENEAVLVFDIVVRSREGAIG